MSRRSVSFLAIIAVAALLALWWFDERQQNAGGNTTNSLLWPNLENSINGIAQIKMGRGDGSAVTLVRNASGWQVAQRNYAADSGKVRKLLLDLASLAIIEQKTREPSRYSVLGVEAIDNPAAAGTLIELFESAQPDSKPGYRLIAGKSAGSRELYARRADDAQSYLLRPSLAVDAQASRWLDTALFDIKGERIRRIATASSGSPGWSIARPDAKSPMQLETGPGTVDATVLASLLGAFAAVNFDDLRQNAAPSASGAGTAVATSRESVSIETFDGLKLDIEGLRDGDRRWLRLAASNTAKDSADEAERLRSRAIGREFEIPSWKFDGFFLKREQIAPAPPRG